MRIFRSIMTIFAFSGIGLSVLLGIWPVGEHTGRFKGFSEWIDGMILSYGEYTVGMGLILFGFAFAYVWMLFGTDR